MATASDNETPEPWGAEEGDARNVASDSAASAAVVELAPLAPPPKAEAGVAVVEAKTRPRPTRAELARKAAAAARERSRERTRAHMRLTAAREACERDRRDQKDSLGILALGCRIVDCLFCNWSPPQSYMGSAPVGWQGPAERLGKGHGWEPDEGP